MLAWLYERIHKKPASTHSDGREPTNRKKARESRNPYRNLPSSIPGANVNVKHGEMDTQVQKQLNFGPYARGVKREAKIQLAFGAAAAVAPAIGALGLARKARTVARLERGAGTTRVAGRTVELGIVSRARQAVRAMRMSHASRPEVDRLNIFRGRNRERMAIRSISRPLIGKTRMGARARRRLKASGDIITQRNMTGQGTSTVTFHKQLFPVEREVQGKAYAEANWKKWRSRAGKLMP